MRSGPLGAVVLVALGLQACALVVDFGPDRVFGPGAASSGTAGAGGAAGAGGVGGEGGAPTPEHFCEPGGEVAWLRTFGDAGDDYITALAAAPEGGLYASGMFRGEIDLGGGPIKSVGARDLFVARFDEDGEVLWTNRYGKNLDDGGYPAVLELPAGVVVYNNARPPIDMGAGEYVPQGGGASALTMLSPDGEHLWTTWLDGPGEPLRAELARDTTTGDLIVFVAFYGELDLDGHPVTSNGANDVALVRIQSDTGVIVDSVSFGGGLGDWVQGVAVRADGRILLAGSTEGDIDFGDGPEPTLGGADSYAAALTPDFEFLWARAYAEDGYQHFRDMVLAPDGNMVAVGMMDTVGTVDLGDQVTSGYRDGYVVRISSEDGDLLHGRMISGIDFPGGLAIDEAGNVTLAGEYEDALVLGREVFHSVEGWGDPFILRLSADFTEVQWRWVVTGSYESEGFRNVLIDGEGRVFSHGVFKNDLAIDGCSRRSSAGDFDVMLVRLAQ